MAVGLQVVLAYLLAAAAAASLVQGTWVDVVCDVRICLASRAFVTRLVNPMSALTEAVGRSEDGPKLI